MTTVATTPATWTIDPTHTDVAFAVRHMGLSTVRGRFEQVAGTVETGANGAPTTIRIELATASINTGTKDRDAHLRSADFFDAEAHPAITFVSTRVTARGGERFEVTGDLTMHGVTKPVVLDVEIGEPITDPWGLQRRAAMASGKINRKDWDLTWNKILEAGALLVSEDVKLSIDVQVTQQG